MHGPGMGGTRSAKGQSVYICPQMVVPQEGANSFLKWLIQEGASKAVGYSTDPECSPVDIAVQESTFDAGL